MRWLLENMDQEPASNLMRCEIYRELGEFNMANRILVKKAFYQDFLPLIMFHLGLLEARSRKIIHILTMVPYPEALKPDWSE